MLSSSRTIGADSPASAIAAALVRLLAVGLVHRVAQRGRRGQRRLDAAPGHRLEIGQQRQRVRIGDRDVQHLVGDAQRQRAERARGGGVEQRERVLARLELGGRQPLEPVLHRERAAEVVLADHALEQQHLSEPRAGALLLGQCGLQLPHADHAEFDEDAADLLAFRHGATPPFSGSGWTARRR
jgi:hypothetical protein